MSDNDEMPKLRMAPRETVDAAIRRVEKEQRAIREQRARDLERGTDFRIGSVPYLNSVPLTRGIENETVFLPPSQLAEKLRQGELDAALVSITEVLFNDLYDVLDGVAIASLGEVMSVYLAHTVPLEEITEIHCDPASLTSVNLLKVILAEHGLAPEFKTLDGYRMEDYPEAVLLIGNPAIDFRRSEPSHQILDLGAAWYEMTGLPFVYAVWAIRREANTPALCSHLKEARDFGLDTLDFIISDRTEYDRDFRQDYLGWHIHFHLGSDEKRGIERFMELLEKHQVQKTHPLNFVT